MNILLYFRRNPKARYVDSSTLRANARHRGTYEEVTFFDKYDIRLYPIFANAETLAAAGDLDIRKLEPIIIEATMFNKNLPPKEQRCYLTNKELAAALGRYQEFEAWQNNYVIQFLQAYKVIVS